MESFADDIMTPEEFSTFRERVVSLREKFILLGRGSRAKCAYDLKIHQTRIGYLLIAKHIDMALCEKVEKWAEAQELPADLLTDDSPCEELVKV